MYRTSDLYKKKIYSGDARHKLEVSFLENADLYCEKLTVKPRIIPNGSKRFGLDNFVSKEAELVLHHIDLNEVPEQIEISIGTQTSGDYYENVPIGIFNINDKPTTDKDKTTFKLYDNAVKFDFGYNGQELIDANDGKATKKQILQDICSKAGVTLNVTTFLGENDEVGSYDSTISARVYISYLAEQAGAIATIDRDGSLIFVYLNNLEKVKIPLSIVEKYSIGKPYTIGRVLYEDGIRKFDKPKENEEYSGDLLYINASNPYISSQEQIDNIYNIVKNFNIDSLTTGKILGDPAIDPWDIFEIYDDSYGDYGVIYNDTPIMYNGRRVVFPHYIPICKSLASYTMTYNGKIINTYDTQIGEEVRNENVSILGEANFKRYAKTSIDNINNNIDLIVEEQDEQSDRITNLNTNINNIQALFQLTGGSNLIRNSQFLLSDDVWTRTINENGYLTELGRGYNSSLIGQTTSIANIVMKNASIVTKTGNISNLKLNQPYNLTFYYTNDANTTSSVSLVGSNVGQVVINKTYSSQQDNITKEEISFIALDTDYTLTFTTSTTLDGYFTIYDLMLNSGDTKPWEPAMSEVYSTVLKMSQLGIQIYASGSNTLTLMTSMGFAIYKSTNGEIGQVVTDFTSEGIDTVNIYASGRIKNGIWVERDLTINNKITHIEYMEVD